jgi:hypothetical protein
MSFNSFSIKNDKVIQNNELLAINFEMWSKKFIQDINN